MKPKTKNELSSTLFLKTSDISTNNTLEASSSVGYWTNGRAIQTFRVDLRKLLGDSVYNNHDYFKLRLNSYSNNSTTGINWSNFTGDYVPYVVLSGLNFVNNSYNVVSQNNGGFGAVLGAVNLTTTANAINIFTEDSAVVYFCKTTEIDNLTFSFYRIFSGGGIIDTTNTGQVCMPFSTFRLQISGVSEEEILAVK